MTFRQVSDVAAPQVAGAQALYHQRMIATHLEQAIAHAEAGAMVSELGQAFCAALDTICAGAPDVPFPAATRSDAALWADSATPVELECYAAAALDRIGRATFAPRARKRIFVAIWESMDKAERRKFLSRVDPDGQFLRGAA